MDTSKLTRDVIATLRKLYPTADELNLLREVADPSVPFDRAERYLLRLSSIPQFEARMSCWSFLLEYTDAEENILQPLLNIKTAMDEVMKSSGLRIAFALILEIGNYLNGGSYDARSVIEADL